jgi:ribonuclease HI
MGCSVAIFEQQTYESLRNDKDAFNKLTNGECTISYGSITGECVNSFKAEINGIYQALKVIEPYPDIFVELFLDNQAACTTINDAIGWDRKSILKKLRTPCNGTIDAIFKLLKARKGPCFIKWIKGHHTSAGNNIADHYAGKHGLDADRFSNTFKQPIHEGDSIKVVPLADDLVIEEDYRKSIKHRQQEQYSYQVL